MRARALLLLSIGGALLPAAPAAALEPGSIGDEPVRVDITDASSVIYNVDNRDSKPNQVSTRANDDWGLWYNRLNIQGSWGKWNAGLRLDNAWFYRSPYPEQIALDLVNERPASPGALSAPPSSSDSPPCSSCNSPA